MAKLTIEFDDNILAAAIVSAIGSGNATATVEADNGSDADWGSEDLLDLCEKFKTENSAKELKELLAEFDVKTPKAAAKADDETIAEICETLAEALDGEEEAEEEAEEEEADDEGDDDEGDDDEGVDVATVKKACQAYSKENGKDALKELLEEFDIKSAAKLGTLDQDDLDELYAELQG